MCSSPATGVGTCCCFIIMRERRVRFCQCFTLVEASVRRLTILWWWCVSATCSGSRPPCCAADMFCILLVKTIKGATNNSRYCKSMAKVVLQIQSPCVLVKAFIVVTELGASITSAAPLQFCCYAATASPVLKLINIYYRYRYPRYCHHY